MTTEVVKRDPRDIAIGQSVLTATGISVENPPTEDEFHAMLAFVGRAGTASNWWIGDLANMADELGDWAVQALDRLGIPFNSQREYARVSQHVGVAIRMATLSWAHHQVVSALPPPQQKKWLKKSAPKDGGTVPRLSMAELKKAIREERITAEREANPLPTGTFRVMYDDGFVPDWTEEDREECLGPIHEDDWPTDEEIYEATPDYPGKKAWPF